MEDSAVEGQRTEHSVFDVFPYQSAFQNARRQRHGHPYTESMSIQPSNGGVAPL